MLLSAGNSVRVDVGSVPTHNRVNAWTEAICSNFYPLEISDPAESFEVGRLEAVAMPGIRLGALESDSYTVHRRPAHIGERGGDYYFLPIPKKHALTLRQREQEAVLRPGAFTVVSTCEPYQYFQGSYNELMTIRVDGALMRNRIPTIDDMLADRRDSDLPLVRLFSGFVASVLVERERLGTEEVEAIAPRLLDLLALALSAPTSGSTSTETSVRLAHLRRINLKVESRLSDFGFTPALLASELGLSQRYVQKILAESGNTASGLIKARRIATAKRRLSDPLRSSESIASVAHSVGFIDAAHFSRVFKETVGASPRDYRKSAIDGLGT